MPPDVKKTCEKCGMTKSKRKEFFTMKNGEKDTLCKDCLTRYIDNRNPETFLWLLERYDVPYIEQLWIQLYNQKVRKLGTVPSNGVIGEYLRQMVLSQYRGYHYSDSEQLTSEWRRNKEEIAAQQAANSPEASAILAELQKQLDSGEINQNQFDTLNPLNIISQSIPETEDMLEEFDMDEKKKEEAANAAKTPEQLKEEEQFNLLQEYEDNLLSSLTDDEIKMLRQKWGSTYKPSQWIHMENTYQQYAEEYELNVDRDLTLKQICKLELKMTEALDIGDTNGYRSLSAAYDSLRKSSKFTESQNVKETDRYLDSIGELVEFVEKEGGIIENLPNPDDTPQDSIDYAIKNMKTYYHDVVTNELGLGNMIEAYIKRLEQAEDAENFDMNKGLLEDEEEVRAEYDAQQDYLRYVEFGIDEEIEQIIEGSL